VRGQSHFSGSALATVRGFGITIGYFYDGLSEAQQRKEREISLAEPRSGEVMARKETLDLIRAYYQLGERPRRRLLDLAKSLNSEPVL